MWMFVLPVFSSKTITNDLFLTILIEKSHVFIVHLVIENITFSYAIEIVDINPLIYRS